MGNGPEIGSLKRLLCAGTSIGLTSIILLCGNTARGGSIFDDDWVPPTRDIGRQDVTRPVAPESKVAVPPPAPEKPPEVAPASTPNGENGRPKDNAPRQPVPLKSALSASRKSFREAYARDIADRSPGARRALAEKLLDAAKIAADNAADQFALLSAAVEAADDGGDLPLGFRVADEISSDFLLDGLALKADTVTKTVRTSDPALAPSNCQAGMALMKELTGAEEFAMASKLGAVLVRAAPGAVWRQAVQRAVQETEAARSARDTARLSGEKLKNNPTDKQANLVVGKYECLVRNDWAQGAAKLALGSDTTLAALAARDVANPEDGDAQAALADAWWEYSQKQAGSTKASIEARAAFWYRKALPSASPIKKTLYFDRIARGERANHETVCRMYRFGDESNMRLTALNDSSLPDDLSVALEPGKIIISGVKKSNTVGGVGWFGKAGLVEGKTGSGTIRVAPDTVRDGPHYYVLLQDTEGHITISQLDLREKGSYRWSVLPSESGDEVVFQVTGSNDTGKGARMKLQSLKAFGFAVAQRNPGSTATMAVTLE
ncbi:MAG: hypothetical protein JWP03_3942 [Phycisphaerales bacterium]|nr:hypothetical protein [Phycisphaerales bacterium]